MTGQLAVGSDNSDADNLSGTTSDDCDTLLSSYGSA